jgi:hypothetical protein
MLEHFKKKTFAKSFSLNRKQFFIFPQAVSDAPEKLERQLLRQPQPQPRDVQVQTAIHATRRLSTVLMEAINCSNRLA